MTPGAALEGVRFWKMTGSGNDFVFLDGRGRDTAALETPEAIGRLCSRTGGVGADGVVVLDRDPDAAFRIRYYNRDGSRAELCGNASLCSTTLAAQLGIVPAGGDFRFGTDSGVVSARRVDGNSEVDFQPASELVPEAPIALGPGERRIGAIRVGVPHLVVLVDDAEAVDLLPRGLRLRSDPSQPAGANVNFVSSLGPGIWRMRTYERGVEAETLSCGTGSVATGIMLGVWGLSGERTVIRTSSGLDVVVTVRRSGDQVLGSLMGEGRLVFTGSTVAL